jgi:hypothetical protein
VPANRVVEAAAELEPLFAMLADTEAKAENMRASADQRIAENHRLTAARATEVLAHASLRAEAERADASAKARVLADQAVAQELAASEDEAAGIQESANELMDAQVAEIVAAVRQRLAGLERQ